jgi:hypothetical protein
MLGLSLQGARGARMSKQDDDDKFLAEIFRYTLELKKYFEKSMAGELDLVRLPDLLRHDTWQAPFGLLPLLGLSLQSGVVIQNDQWEPVKISHLEYLDGRLEDRNESTDGFRLGFLERDTQGYIAIDTEITRQRWDKLASDFGTLLRYWNTGEHPRNNAPSYYVKWALSKNIDVPWLDAAQRLGFLRDVERNSSSTPVFMKKSRVSPGQLNDEVIQSLIQRQTHSLTDLYSNSALKQWLKLPTWSYEEGMYLLADIVPNSVKATMLDSFPDFDNALPLGFDDLLMIESWGGFLIERHDFRCSDEAYSAYMQLLKFKGERTAVLGERVKALDYKLQASIKGLGEPAPTSHSSIKRYTPKQFLTWAATENFKPDWFDWATAQNLIEASDSALQAPFFDADSEDYPELLHIAVRAWDAVRREETTKTPKQRILAYLERYSHLSEDARNAIASVANWRKSGGRPKKGG